jgi:hypothetical protein
MAKAANGTRRAKRPLASWKPRFRPGVPAPVAFSALMEIEERQGSKVTPAAVVDAARDTAHPLHKCFTWEDSVAAEKWREQEARLIINCLEVKYAESDRPVAAFLNIKILHDDGGRAYLPSDVVMSDADYRGQALADALAYLKGFETRFRDLEELADVFAAIEKVRKRAKRKQTA